MHTSAVLVQPQTCVWVTREFPAGSISAEVEILYWESIFLLPFQEFSCCTNNSESGLRNGWLKITIKQANFIVCFWKTRMQLNHVFELHPGS